MNAGDLARRSRAVRAVARMVHARRRRAGSGRAPSGPGRPPDFVGVGVQRAGTTRWFELVVAHPGAGPGADGRKERHFFDRFWHEPWTCTSAAEYHRAFPASDPRCLGEWTPRYCFDPWVPELLVAAAPDAKVLLILRDPLARLVSGLGQVPSFRRAVDPARVTEAFARGLYSDQVERLLGHVDRSRLLVLQHESCTLDPAGQLARTYAHLGLEP